MSVSLLFLAGRSDFHKTVETACQSKRAAECVRVCLQLSSLENTSLSHQGGRGVKEESGIGSSHGRCGSGPCKGKGTCDCLGSDSGLCAGNRGNDIVIRDKKPEKRIYRICYFSKSRFSFFFLILIFIFMLSSSPSFPLPYGL